MTTLISFLGRGRRDSSGTRYLRANYEFEDGRRVRTSFFGLGLAEKLDVDKLVILGTERSIWDVFAEHFAEDEQMLEDVAELGLDRAVAEGSVTQQLLDRLAPLAAQKLRAQVRFVLIPYARDTPEQVEVLQRMADSVDASEHIVLDVTHGFRHLPMLALVAARYLAKVRRVKVENIYYGALEMAEQGSGYVPVLKLNGMLRLLDWVDAIEAYRKDGDFGDVASLLEDEGLQTAPANELRKAAFYERTSNSVRASQALTSALPEMSIHPGMPGGLFVEELRNRVAWFRSGERADKELALADIYFERRDYLRTAIFMLESAVTREVFKRKENWNDYEQRDSARRTLCESSTHVRRLDSLRNALAHGVRSRDGEIARILEDEVACRVALTSIRRSLPR
jgi:CRISPR-associated Csx2 family protein